MASNTNVTFTATEETARRARCEMNLLKSECDFGCECWDCSMRIYPRETHAPCGTCTYLAACDGECCKYCPYGKWGYWSTEEQDSKLHTFLTIEGDVFVSNGRSVPSPAYDIVDLGYWQFAVVYTHIDGSLSTVPYLWTAEGELKADGNLNDHKIDNDEDEQLPIMMEIFQDYRSRAMHGRPF